MLFAVSRVKASISELCQEPWSVIAWPSIDLALSKLLNPGDKSLERLNKLLLKMLSLNSSTIFFCSSGFLWFLIYFKLAYSFFWAIYTSYCSNFVPSWRIICSPPCSPPLANVSKPPKKLGLSSFDFVLHCLIYCIPESSAHLSARKKMHLDPFLKAVGIPWINQPTNLVVWPHTWIWC